jgi:tetratricopeptide (TPR) repeat protein
MPSHLLAIQKVLLTMRLLQKLDANDPSASYALGRCYIHTGRYTQASEILSQLVVLMPDHALGHYQLGFALLQQFSRRSEAIPHFKRAIEICPRITRAYFFLGWALVRVERDIPRASRLLDEIKELRPNEARHLANLISLNEPNN